MNLRCELVESVFDQKSSFQSWYGWADGVKSRVWKTNEQGEYYIDEHARREEVEKRAYFMWLDGSNDQVNNWLQAEKDVNLAVSE